MALLAPLMGACGDVTPRWNDVDEEDPIVLQACRWAGDECIYDDEDDYEEEDQGADEDPGPKPTEPKPIPKPKPKYDEGGCKRTGNCDDPDEPWDDSDGWPEPNEDDGGGDGGGWSGGDHDGGC